MWGESVQVDPTNTEKTAAAAMAVAGQDAPTRPRTEKLSSPA